MENALAAMNRAASPARLEWGHPARRLRDGGKKRDLGPAQIFDRLVEIAACGIGDAVNAVAVRHEAKIVAQDRLTAITRSEQESGESFRCFVKIAALLWVLQSRHLH